MTLHPKSLFVTVLSLAISASLSTTSPAQDEGVVPASYHSGSFFSRELGTSLRMNYHTNGYGTQEDVVSLGAMKVHNLDGATLFVDGQGTLSEDFGGGFNLGVGYRELTTMGLSFDAQRILGIGFWTDGQSTASDNFFTQLGFSLESLGDSFDLRLNGHFPLESTETSEAILTGTGASLFSGHNLFNATERVTIDSAHNVLDGEFAKRISDLEAWAFVGGYHLGGGGVDDVGYRAGIRGYAVPDLAVSLQVTDDDVYGNNVMVGMTWFIGRTNKTNAPCGTILDRFREPVLRNDFIATTSRQTNRAAGTAATDTDTLLAENFYFVDSAAAAGGDGTFENPFQTLAEADAAHAEFDTVVALAGSSFTDDSLVLKNNADYLGFGGDIVHVVDTANFGSVTLPDTTAGAAPILNFTGGQTAFTAGDNSQVNNAQINAAGIGAVADGVEAAQFANLVINDAATGVVLRNTTGTTVVENTVEINRATGTALFADQGDGALALAATINDTTGRSLAVENRTGGSVNFTGAIDDDASGANTSLGMRIADNTGGTVTISNPQDIHVAAGGIGFEIDNNTDTTINATGAIALTAAGTGQGLVVTGQQSGSAVTLDDLTVTAEDGDAVHANGNADGNIVINQLVATTSGTGDGVQLDHADGSLVGVSVGNATINANGTGRGFAATGGGVINVNGTNEINSVGATAFEVTDAENLIASNVTITNTTAQGVVVTGQDSATDAVTLANFDVTTTTADAVRVAANTNGTVNLNDLTAESTTGDTVVIDDNGAGTVNINGVSATATGTGDALVASTSGNLSATGTNNLSANTGRGLAISDMVIDGGATFTNVEVTAGAGRGIDLDTNTGGAITVNGGTLTTDGNAVSVINSDSVAINGVTIDNTTGNGLVAANSAGDVLSVSNLAVTTTTGNGVQVDGGTLTATGTNTIETTTGRGLGMESTIIGGSGASFRSVDVNGALNGVVLTEVSGGTVRVGAAAATGVDGAGGTLATTGTAIALSGVNNAVFNDVTVTSSGATDLVDVSHTSATASSITFDNLTLTAAAGNGNGIVLTDSGNGEIDFTLRNSTVDVSLADTVGFELVTGASTGEIDVRLDNSGITTGDNSAVLANLSAGTGDVQFLVTGNGQSTWTNNSATSAAGSFLVSTGRTLNLTVGNQTSAGAFDENRFENLNAGGTAFAVESNNGLATVNLDLRGNTASGGGLDFQLTETLGTFSVVDLTATVTGLTNNSGAFDLGGGVEADFTDLAGPIKQVD